MFRIWEADSPERVTLSTGLSMYASIIRRDGPLTDSPYVPAIAWDEICGEFGGNCPKHGLVHVETVDAALDGHSLASPSPSSGLQAGEPPEGIPGTPSR
jgi:hypothetical protein